MGSGARFWTIDFHVHTPASKDADVANYGSTSDIVQAAISAGLDAIAITDHNTATMCEEIAAAAAGHDLVVLPGVEVSTTEGHLLAIWEEGTAESTINDLLATLGISTEDRGKLDISAQFGFAEASKRVAESGGIAIAAHADRPKGVLALPVAAHLTRTLLEPSLSGVELVHLDRQSDIDAKVGKHRVLATVQGSDTWDAKRNVHSLSAIGARRTWIKATRPDLIGIRHALADPELRTRLEAPASSTYPRIERIEINGGFLSGQEIDFSPDLNSLLGGTGAGKSLVIEAIRFALNQQISMSDFPELRKEVDSRLISALGDGTTVKVHAAVGPVQYQVARQFFKASPKEPVVRLRSGGDWAEIDVDVAELIPLAAFSQGEILEYSRRPVGRMNLVDSALDLGDIEARLSAVAVELRSNARALIGQRTKVRDLTAQVQDEPTLSKRARQLALLFKSDLVKSQGDWTAEQAALGRAVAQLDAITIPAPYQVEAGLTASVTTNAKTFERASKVLEALNSKLREAETAGTTALEAARTELKALSQDWNTSFEAFATKLDEQLESVAPGESLTALRAQLQDVQLKLTASTQAKTSLDTVAQPELTRLVAERESLLSDLMSIRKERRELRRLRVAELNSKAAGFVRLDVPSESDQADFREALASIKVGSRAKEDFLDALALRVHPIRFSKQMWSGDTGDLVDENHGIDAVSLARLLTNIEDRNLWPEVFEMQLIDRPDLLSVKFRKPEDGDYSDIEDLAHGQRCTAILVVLLADGSTPVLVDQPEDALHAPWIEDYLVDRLRSLRGSRQYIFATRSPGIVVSADSEQIVTMHATAGHGEVEASGSLERHSLNDLTMHHLEGGSIAFGRRARKLRHGSNGQ